MNRTAGGRLGSSRPPFLLVLAAIVVLALVALPLLYLVVRAVGGGLDPWEILLRPGTVELIAKTALLAASVAGATILVAVPLAWLVTRTDLPGRRFWAVAAALPLVIPSYVAALTLLAAFGPTGLIQGVLERLFDVQRVPEIYGFGGALLALVISTYPYVFVLTAGALRRVDPALEETAGALGRGRLSTFLTVTLPLVRPAIGTGALLAALYALSDFGAVSLMRADSLTRAIFLQYRSLFDRSPAAVLALVLVLVTALLLAFELRSRGHVRYGRSAPGSARRQPLVRLGRWRWLALGYCASVMGLALGAPLAVLGYWLTRSGSAHDLGATWAAAVNSASVSSLAAVAAVAAALPTAILAARYPAWWSQLLERAAYATNALPGIVIALALVFFAANYASPVYQTVGLLVFAYVVRFFPQAVAGSYSALLTVGPGLEEAARGLGRGPRGTFASVTAPLAAPGILAGGVLVFLSAMKELPATLLLRPIGFDTLAVEVWTATTVGAYSEAALPALALIVLSAPLVYFLLERRGTPPLEAPG